MGFLPTQAQKQKTVYVSTPSELIEQIAPDRIIRLKSSLFLLSETNLRTNNPYVNLRYEKEGLAIEIRQVDNLSLIGEKAMNVRLIHNGRNQTILRFTDCKNLRLQDLEIGFGAGPRPAEGRLLVFQNVKGLNLSNLRLWGGSREALHLVSVQEGRFDNLLISHCTQHALTLLNCAQIDFMNCHFVGNQGLDLLNILASEKINLEACRIEYNQTGTGAEYDSYALINAPLPEGILSPVIFLKKCLILANYAQYFCRSVTAASLSDCQVEYNIFVQGYNSNP
ncbi:MAG: hypothetical protein OHK0053_16830 [Microscillaceae bacterium]